MAIGQGDGSIILSTKVDTKGIKQGTHSIMAMAAKAGAALAVAFSVKKIADFVKASVDAFAEYEQLVGGVETLFKNSADKVMKYANEAYKTAGMSANEYMANVTSFSASLLSSLGGDTDKAAEVANEALISISDNANKMGTNMESVTMAFQGFAKQQYMLLDNLKLGYGGTKTEMERLLKDAQAITGVKYDINNLADVYTAIGVIQEKLGIAGTTAKEASTTISGSAATMKAAWQNVLTAISGGGDLDRAIENLVDSVSIYFENIVPVVERALSGIGKLIEKVAPMLVQTVAKSLIKAIPSLLNAVYEMIVGLANGIYQGIIDLFNGTSREVLTEQADNIEQSVENQNDLTKAVEETNEAMEKTTASFDTVEILSSGAAQNASIEPIIPEVGAGGLGENLQIEEIEKELSAFEKAFKKIVQKIKKAFEPLTKISFLNLGESLSSLIEPIKELGLVAWDILEDAIEKVIAPLAEFAIEDVLPKFFDTFGIAIDGFRVVLDKAWDILEQFIDEFLTPIWEYAEPKILEVWDNLNTKLKDFVKLVEESEAWEDFQTIMSAIYDVLEPVVKAIIDFVTPIIEFKMNSAFIDLELAFKSIEDIIGAIAALINGDFDDAWQHIKELFVDNFVDAGKEKFQAFSDVIEGITGFDLSQWVKDAWENIKKFWTEHIAPIFTKKWWEDLGKTCINGLIAGFEGGINGIIFAFETMINWIVDGLNKISFDIPDWLGGGSFGINLPRANFGRVSIPRLAQGAVIPPNREFLAVLGDQKQGTNIEAPLQTIVDAFNIALSQNGGANRGNTEVVLEIDGREFGRAVVEQGNRENRRIGTRLVIA
jgi:phage-related protein